MKLYTGRGVAFLRKLTIRQKGDSSPIPKGAIICNCGKSDCYDKLLLLWIEKGKK